MHFIGMVLSGDLDFDMGGAGLAASLGGRAEQIRQESIFSVTFRGGGNRAGEEGLVDFQKMGLADFKGEAAGLDFAPQLVMLQVGIGPPLRNWVGGEI